MDLQTDRLVLRPLSMADVPRVAAFAGDYALASMSAVIPHPYSESDAVAWIGEVLAGEEGEVFAIALKGTLIGCIGYRPQDRSHAEIGYWVGRPYWGHGYATEAARAIIGDAFERFGFDYVLCGHFEDNLASRRVIEKLGFTPCGEQMRDCVARGREVRVLLYRLYRDEAAFAPLLRKEA